MAHKKAAGSTKNGRDSNPQYLGVKLTSGQSAQKGAIIVRQRGSKVLAGANVGMGKDHTLFALTDGVVRFDEVRKTAFTGHNKRHKRVSVVV